MKRLSIAEALREAMREEMLRDERVFLIGEDIGIPGGFGGAFTVTLGLSDEFGHERVLDTPISEKAIVGAAVGAAMMGMRPIADVQYSDFLFCAADEIVNQAAKMTYMSGGTVKVPMVLRAPVGATNRGAQHAQSPEGFFMHVPGWKIAVPATAYDAKGLLKTAVRDDSPVLIFEHKRLYGKGGRKEAGGLDLTSDIPDEEYLIPFGQASVRCAGTDLTIIATLLMMHRSLAAADSLAQEGISVEVIDPRTLVPFDDATVLASVAKTGRLLIVEEDNLTGGWGAEVAARVADAGFDLLDAPIKRVASYDVPMPFAPVLENFVVPSVERIVEAAQALVRGKV